MTETHSTELVAIHVPGAPEPIMATEIDGTPMAALKPICEAMGIAYTSQLEKLRRRSWATVTPRRTVAADGKTREMMLIDHRTLGMWLATIDENRVNKDARKHLIAFQNEAADALDAYFRHGRAENPRGHALSTFDILRAQIDQLEAAQRTADEAKAIATTTEARLDAIEGRHDWFSALGYARDNGLNTNAKYLAKIGRQATMIAKSHDIEPVKVQHAHYGKVNSYPRWIWELAAAAK